ncbi:MAG: hypothetical protein AAGK21_01580 [Bacteroidota bacterium]
MRALPLALTALLVLPLAACGGGGDEGDFDGEVEETGEPGILGRVQEFQDTMEEMQEAAERPPAEPVNFRELRELLPGEVAGLAQGDTEGSTDAAMGFAISRIEAPYANEDGKQIDIAIHDFGAIPQVTMFGLGWTLADIDRESGSTYERTVEFGGQRGYRSYDTEAQAGEFSLLVAERFHVEVTGSGVTDDELEDALRAVDLNALAGMRDAGRPDA